MAERACREREETQQGYLEVLSVKERLEQSAELRPALRRCIAALLCLNRCVAASLRRCGAATLHHCVAALL